MDNDFNTQAIELLGADTPGVIAAALQEAYEMGREEMKDEIQKREREHAFKIAQVFGDDPSLAPSWLVQVQP